VLRSIALAAVVVGLVPLARVEPAAAAPGERTERVVPGTGSPRPRILYAPDQTEDLRGRLEREPYRSLFVSLHQRTVGFDASHPVGDPSIGAQRDLGRVAKNLAFEYALDRTVSDGAIVPFPDEAIRAATGDHVRDLLLTLYPRSRLAVPPPLGGWDRDISTSEEIIDYATAFDTMLGTEYRFGDQEQVIADRLGGLVSELWSNYTDPSTVGGVTNLMQNNHRSKVGAALAVAAIVLAEWQPPTGGPSPLEWFDYGVLQVDDVLRFILTTGDGAYGEGTHYYRFTAQNLLPLARAWERHIGPGSYRVDGIDVPSPWRHPLFARSQRWMLDTTLPDGTQAPIDDGNTNEAYYFGVLPSFLPETSAYYWRWSHAPRLYETDGHVDLGADAIVTYDDSVVPAPPSWSPTQFYAEGGTATFRSGWDDQAVMVLALGEHDTASEFGRDRAGAARAPQSHEHADPGAFLLHAFGERLALDPGYLSFTTHGLVNQPQHHNTVLVDGQGPGDYLLASFNWLAHPDQAPPAEGQSTLNATVDGAGLDAATVRSSYRGADLDRRLLFLDDRYLVVADQIGLTDGGAAAFTWMLHGNGGGTSGGVFEPLASGGRWTIGGARLDSAIGVSTDSGSTDVVLDTADFTHERDNQEAVTHTALEATVTGTVSEAVQLLYPSRVGEPPPTLASVALDHAAATTLVDAAGDRRVVAARSGDPTQPLVAPGAWTDGTTLVADAHLDGRLRLVWADAATTLSYDGVVVLQSSSPRSLGLRLGDDGTGSIIGAAGTKPSAVTVRGLPFMPQAVDGACGFAVRAGGAVRVTLTRDSSATLRSTPGNGQPAADAGRDRTVDPGTTVRLDGRDSCDPNGDRLTPHWELVSAPAGSAWTLRHPNQWQPKLLADQPGTYRVRLTVTDPSGAKSTEAEVMITA
jgi:hypothetical protein